MTHSCFQVRKNDFRQTRFVPTSLSTEAEPAAAGDLLLRVDRFAITANNITYALYGDILGYWQFYPAPEGWGIIPCWGFAEVIDSGCPAVAVGERLFGYWPIASTARLTPDHIEPGFLTEGVSHRKSLHPFYNRYLRFDPSAQSADDEAWQSLFRPLGLTGYMLEDIVFTNDAWGAKRVVLSSASSKTAVAAAHFLKQRGQVEVVGLTDHVAYATHTGCYDRVETYSAIESLASIPTVYIDLAGDLGVTQRVHTQLSDVLRKSFLVGGTHWDKTGAAPVLPGPQPELFFVPDYAAKRMADWGGAASQQRIAGAWQSLMPVVQKGIKLVFAEGEAAVGAAYQSMLDGTAQPDRGHILHL